MLDKNEFKTRYVLGVIAPRNFTDMALLRSLLTPNISRVSMIVTNSVISGGELVQMYAKEIGVPFTVYPIIPQTGGALISNAQIIKQSEFVYIFSDGISKNALNAKLECDKQGKKSKMITFAPSV